MSLPLPSTFMPLPLPMMIPFMGIQSGVMAFMFGQNFQFGKRKISAMSNEEFNALTFEKLMTTNLQSLKGMIPAFEKSLADMRPFTEFIIREFGVMITQLIGTTGNQFDKATQTAQDDFYHFMGWGHAPTSYHSDGTLHEGATETLPPPLPDPEPEPEPTPEPPPVDTGNLLITVDLTFSFSDPIAGTSRIFQTGTRNHAGHMQLYNNITTEQGVMEDADGNTFSGTAASILRPIYLGKINAFYGI